MNKKIYIFSGLTAFVVALVVGLGFIAALSQSPTPVSDPQSVGALSGPVVNTPNNFTAGLSTGSNNVEFTFGGTIPTGSNRVVWTNKTGRIVYVPEIDVSTIGTTSNQSLYPFFASSTENVYAFATTSTSASALLTYDFTAPVNNASTTLLINKFIIATSTSATTTSSMNLTGQGDTVADVPPGGSIVIQLSTAVGCLTTAGVCESATSTSRGFNIKYFGKAYYAP